MLQTIFFDLFKSRLKILDFILLNCIAAILPLFV